jgi:hypothetical protein
MTASPDAERWDDNYYGDETNWQAVRRLWDIALEEETDPQRTRMLPGRRGR